MRDSKHRRLPALAAAVVALAVIVAPTPALAATVTAHVSGHSKLSLGKNTLGVPFFVGVFGETPVVYGTLTKDGSSVGSTEVDLQYREARDFASAPWKTVCQSTTKADGSYEMRAANCVLRGFTPWHPQRSGGLRVVVDDPTAVSHNIGWIVVPDIHITASTRAGTAAGSATYRIGGRLVASANAAGTLMLTRVGESAELARTNVRGGRSFALDVNLTRSGTQHFRLDFLPGSASDDSQPVSRDLALDVTVGASTRTVVARPAVQPRVPKATLAANLPDIPL